MPRSWSSGYWEGQKATTITGSADLHWLRVVPIEDRPGSWGHWVNYWESGWTQCGVRENTRCVWQGGKQRCRWQKKKKMKTCWKAYGKMWKNSHWLELEQCRQQDRGQCLPKERSCEAGGIQNAANWEAPSHHQRVPINKPSPGKQDTHPRAGYCQTPQGRRQKFTCKF